MNLLGIILLSSASIGAIGLGIHRQIKFSNFRKYGEDDQYKMISGVVSTIDNSNNQTNSSTNFTIKNGTYSLEPDTKTILKELSIERGEKKTRVVYQSIYSPKGKYVCSIPYTQEYIDWTNIFNNRFNLPTVKVGTHIISLIDIKNVDEPAKLTVTGHCAHNIFKSIKIDDTHFRNSNQYEFNVKFINNGDNVSVIGMYNNKFTPMYIGSRENVLSKISRRNYTRYPFIFVGLFGLVLSGFLFDEYSRDNHQYYKRSNNY